MKNKNLKYILLIAIVVAAAYLLGLLPNERPVTHMVSNNPAERRAKP